MTVYGVSGADLQTPLDVFWTSVLPYMPPVVHAQVQTGGDQIDDETGDLIGSWVGVARAIETGSGGADYAAPAGACVTWLTPIIRDGHRIKGRSYLVPLSQEFYQNDGSLQTDALAAVVAAAEAFVTAAAGNLRIWHRPRLARAETPEHKALTAHVGSQAAVISSAVADKVAVLRSRRD